MDLVTLELILFVVITLYTDVILCSEFIASCKTTLTLTDYETYISLHYDGTFLTDSFGKPCEAVVDIKHTSYTNTKICVKLFSGHDKCTRFFKFYYAEDPYQYYNCEQIQYEAVCKQSDNVFAEFQPWSKTAEYLGKIKIHVYIQTYIETPLDNKLYEHNVGVGIALGCFVVVVIISIIVTVVKRRQKDGNNSRQAINQPPPQLTRNHSQEGTQGNQSPSLSAEPPSYTDVMAAENRQNNVSSTCNRGTVDITGPQVCHRLQDLTIKPSAPPPYNDTIPEEPPPPYPGYSQYM